MNLSFRIDGNENVTPFTASNIESVSDVVLTLGNGQKITNLPVSGLQTGGISSSFQFRGGGQNLYNLIRQSGGGRLSGKFHSGSETIEFDIPFDRLAPESIPEFLDEQSAVEKLAWPGLRIEYPTNTNPPDDTADINNVVRSIEG